MRKIIYIALFFIIMMPLFAFAKVLPYKIFVCSLQEIQTNELNQGKYYTFQTIDNYQISKDEYIEDNSSVTIKINQYIKPKRGKRNGYLKITLVQYTIPSEDDKIINLSDKHITGTLRLSNHLDKKELVKKVGITAAGHFLKIPGFTQAVAVSKGILNPNPNQNRLQSAGNNLYETTPLPYTEKGDDLMIEEDAILVISVKNKEK